MTIPRVMPTVTQLEYLLAVHRTGHFGRAAEECGVSQPTLSAQIQKAEAELGLTVFDRNRKPIEPTPNGQLVLQQAQEVVAAHERLLWVSQGQRVEPSGDFVLGIIPTLAPYVLPWFLLEFSKKYPKVNLELFEKPTDALVDEMIHQRMDAAILSTPLDEARLEEVPLFYDPFYLYANKEETILEEAEAEVRDLDGSKMWLLEDGHCVRAQIVTFCSIAGTNLHLKNISFAAGSFETLRNIIDNTEGYSLFPETFVRTLPKSVKQAQVRPFATKVPIREVAVAFPKSSWKTNLIDALNACIADNVPRALRQVSPNGDILPIRPPSSATPAA